MSEPTTKQPSEWALTRTIRLSRRLSVTFTFGPAGSVVEWDPARPDQLGTTLTKKELRNYRNGRDALYAELGERLGGSVLVVEV
jgi:hypothetical protein